MENNLPDFSQKIVLVHFAPGTASGFAAVEGGRFETHGTSLFLVGKAPKVKLMSWGQGATVGISWPKVQSYYVFDTVEDLRRAVDGGVMQRLFS